MSYSAYNYQGPHKSGNEPAPCIICGADGAQRVWTKLMSHYAVNVRSDAHSILGSEISVTVCKQCGNIQLFTNPGDFK